MTLAEVADATGGTLHQVTDPQTRIEGRLSFDSRHIDPGGLFACLDGRSRDGHDFAVQAVRDGAAAVLATRPVDAPAILVTDVLTAMADIARTIAARYTGTVIALTGSAGKTTTKDLLHSILAPVGPTVATEKSFNNEIGFPVTVSRVTTDTHYLVLEMGARGPGHIAHLCRVVRPAVATVLGIGSAHIGEFGSKEAIAAAKAEIVQALPHDGVAVLYGDDPMVLAMAAATPARIVTFGTGPDCDLRAHDIEVDEQGRPHFTMHWQGQHAAVQLPVHGRHNVTNALAAATSALAAGVTVPQVTAGLAHATLPSGGRMEVNRRPDGVTVINDAFNASPESVLAALDALADIAGPHRRTIAVLGHMAELGPDADTWHDTVARKVVATGVHHLITTGGPHAQDMTRTVLQAGLDARDADPHTPLTAQINAFLRPGDVVLIKGANALNLEAVARELACPDAP
nr:UDP-N-acetylmuramoyl-tripeptide--D-alanyl-D-alanine ligase [Streptomyces sp. SID13666]